MNKGTVKWFNAEKDMDLLQAKTDRTFSYISQQSTEKDSNSLEEGQSVTYDLTEGARGMQAANVEKL